MKFINKNLFNLLSTVFVFLSLSFIPFASAVCDSTSTKICNPIPKVTSIEGFIQTVLIGAIKIGLPVIALAIIYCGFLFVAARGKPEAITKAKDALLYTLIGAAILLGSWAITQMISTTVNGLAS